jgi:hypothetical protein
LCPYQVGSGEPTYEKLTASQIMRLMMLSFLGLATTCLGDFPASPAEAVPTVESVLAKWEEASNKCQSLDAELTVFHYDSLKFGGERSTVERGRFYYEAPNIGYLRIGDSAAERTARGPLPSELIVWNGKETLHIDGSNRTCTRYAAEDLRMPSDPPVVESPSCPTLSEPFRVWFLGLFWLLERPQNRLPLAVDIHAVDVRERFEVAIERSDKEEIELKATPKLRPEKSLYREVRVIVRTNTYSTYAIQVTSANGMYRAVFVLDAQKVNQRPADRDQLLSPDLSGLRVTDMRWGVGECPSENWDRHRKEGSQSRFSDRL